MTTLTLKLSEYEKRAVKTRAAAEGKTMKALILETLGVKKKGTLHEAIKDYEEGRYDSFETLEEQLADIESTWKEAQNES